MNKKSPEPKVREVKIKCSIGSAINVITNEKMEIPQEAFLSILKS